LNPELFCLSLPLYALNVKTMAFDGKKGSTNRTDLVGQLARNHRKNNIAQVQGYFFGKRKLQSNLAQRCYMRINAFDGMNDGCLPQLILTGGVNDGNHLLHNILEVGSEYPLGYDSKIALNTYFSSYLVQK